MGKIQRYDMKSYISPEFDFIEIEEEPIEVIKVSDLKAAIGKERNRIIDLYHNNRAWQDGNMYDECDQIIKNLLKAIGEKEWWEKQHEENINNQTAIGDK